MTKNTQPHVPAGNNTKMCKCKQKEQGGEWRLLEGNAKEMLSRYWA